MPRIAILSDIHSNVHALTAVLNEMERAKVDTIAFGGDIVGYGANPKACVDLVRSHGGICVLGNHDHYTVQLADRLALLENEPGIIDNPVWMGIVHSIRETQGDAIAWLGSLPLTLRLPNAVLSHAALHNQADWPYLSSAQEATPTLAMLDTPVGFFGHTHQTRLFFDKSRPGRPKWHGKEAIEITENCRCALTVGSVGQPRDGDTRAAWVVWDSDNHMVELKKTIYPHLEAANAIIEANLPEHSAMRLLDRAARTLLGAEV